MTGSLFIYARLPYALSVVQNTYSVILELCLINCYQTYTRLKTGGIASCESAFIQIRVEQIGALEANGGQIQMSSPIASVSLEHTWGPQDV